MSVFDDQYRLTDPDDYEGEDRLRTLGMTEDGCTVLYVIYTIREAVIRIISARHAEPRERRLYYANRKI